ncbi:hypothetical protein D3C76_1227770 [compost metagenome]
MLLGQGIEKILAVICQPPTIGEMIAQLADQHRCRALAVVANTAPHPTDVQLFPGRKQRFQQQVTIVLTAGTIARTIIAAHQIEIQGWLGSRVITIIHPQQAHQLERDRAHRHQGTEVDGSGQEALGQSPLIQPGQPRFTHHRQRQFIVQPHRLTGLQPGFTQVFELGQQIVVMLVACLEKQLHQILQA